MDASTIHRITGSNSYAARIEGFLAIMLQFGAALMPLHIFAQVLAQVLHESGRFKYVREGWGPTAAQKRYEGRADLGNTQPGDGFRFLGRDLIQCTGRYNYRALTQWVRGLFPDAPDFEAIPDALERSEWLGISVIWYFVTRPKLMAACETGDCVRVSEIVNGGHNGLADRLELYVRSALVLLGYGPIEVKAFQASAGLTVDGIAGTLTRAALHSALKANAAAPATKVMVEMPPVSAEPAPIVTSSVTSARPWWAAIFSAFGIMKG
ncbi:peptidoglycan-binding protein [Albirhodobacter sp. R86504]|uniref:peptidoglycan-binding protein n=1 Tax=Albirhodobacter sp. R86504 TaxID=3093848 RepID=UPI0036735CEC